MKRIFKVTLHLDDNSVEEFNIAAVDDVAARSNAEISPKRKHNQDGLFSARVMFAEIVFLYGVVPGQRKP